MSSMGTSVGSFFAGLQRFGIGRLITILGIAIGVAGVLMAMTLHLAAEPMVPMTPASDMKEAGQMAAALDQAGIKYSTQGDGTTFLVNRKDKDKAMMLLAQKGLTNGIPGYELFDNAPALGQTEFVQNINKQRALEGELARTIKTLRGVSSVRVHLVLPTRELFSDEPEQPTASVVIGLSISDLSSDQVSAIRNLVAGAVPNLKPSGVTVVDERGRLLAAGGEDDNSLSGAGLAHKNEVEEALRKRVKEIVEGVVGQGAARVTVTADLDPTSTTQEKVDYNPDGQVVRSTQTTESNDKSTQPDPNGITSAAANIPGGAQAPGSTTSGTQSGSTSETTNYEISQTKTTTITGPGEIKKLAVSVAVDDVATPSKDGKSPPTFTKRSADDMKKINDLVAAAVGIDATRGDQLQVINVRFNHNIGDTVGGTAAKPSLFDFDKNDIMRVAEVGVLALVAILVIFMVARPLLKALDAPPVSYLAAANSGGQLAMPGGGMMPAMAGGPAMAQMAAAPGQPAMMAPAASGGAAVAPASVPYVEVDPRIDIARIEGQVKASSVKKVSEFVERHPEESVSILRSWLHDS
jgi:flagellar M-ring protein FliF